MAQPPSSASDCPPAPTQHSFASQPRLWSRHYDVVFVDFTGWLNLAAHVSKSTLQQAQLCAKCTLALLERPADPEGAFLSAFLSRDSPGAAFDYCWTVALPSAASASGGRAPTDKTACREQELRVEALVRAALTDRAKVVRVLPRTPRAVLHPSTAAAAAAGVPSAPPAGDIHHKKKKAKAAASNALGAEAGLALRSAFAAALREGLPTTAVHAEASSSNSKATAASHEQYDVVWVGAQLDPALATRLVDVGPAADDAAAAAKFRSFWGDRAELRRFQDGRISEAVVWDAGPAHRHTIPDRIVQYVLQRHLPAGSLVSACSGGLDWALSERGAEPGADVTAGRLLEAATDKLAKQLRALSAPAVALKVIGVQQLSAAARHTAAFSPLPHPLAGGVPLAEAGGRAGRLPRCLEPLRVMVQLEGSGRWPDHPVAFKKMRAALGVQLATAITSAYGHHAVCSEEHVDVLAEGFAFRLILHSGRDEAMLLKAQQLAQLQQQADPTLPSGSSAAPELSLLSASSHHGLVVAVGAANGAFAPTVRLAQRWVSAHLLSNHVPAEAVELLVAHVFTTRGPLPPPSSRVTGFLRFLDLVSLHPWAQRPLVVDPDRQLSEADHRAIRRSHEQRRAAGAAPALCICTPQDRESSLWTSEHPSELAWRRAVALAQRSSALLRSLLEANVPSAAAAVAGSATAAATLPPVEPRLADWALVFRPAVEEFDAWVVLRKEALPDADRARPAAAQPGGGALASASGAQQPQLFDALSEALTAPPQDPPKAARAFLRAFPEQAIESKGPDKLKPELLVGFDPLGLLLQHLEARFGHVANFCADHLGGRLVGVKWAAAAFLPGGKLKVSTAHTALQCTLSCGPNATAAGNPGAPPVVPNVLQIVAEMRDMGQGIVQDVVLL